MKQVTNRPIRYLDLVVRDPEEKQGTYEFRTSGQRICHGDWGREKDRADTHGMLMCITYLIVYVIPLFFILF